MTPTKLLIGQILIVAIILLGVWGSPQRAASMLRYQPELGPACFPSEMRSAASFYRRTRP